MSRRRSYTISASGRRKIDRYVKASAAGKGWRYKVSRHNLTSWGGAA